MLEQLLIDWRFLVLLAGILLAIGEGRYKLSRHEKLLDADKLASEYALIWSSETQALWAAIAAFWFGGRQFRK
jgi:hypothetical protein